MGGWPLLESDLSGESPKIGPPLSHSQRPSLVAKRFRKMRKNLKRKKEMNEKRKKEPKLIDELQSKKKERKFEKEQ